MLWLYMLGYLSQVILQKYQILSQAYIQPQLSLMSQKHLKNRLGITRHRFSQYLKAKNKHLNPKKRFSKSALRKTMDDDDVAQSTLLNYSTKTSQLQLTQINQPIWMADYRKCCMLLSEVDVIMEEVKEEKAKKIKAVNQDKYRRVIQKYYGEAAVKVAQCQKILKNIEKGADINASAEQRKIFTNTLMSLAMRTRERAKDIRQAQQQDLRERQQLKKFESPILQGQNLMNKDINEDGQFLTEEGFHELQRELHNERNQQILKIVESIHALNTIYKQLQDVVIQQGSLLDRIDQNINTAAFNVKQANQHLTKAEQHQRSPLANRVILVLVLLIIAFTLILAFR